MIMSLQGCIIKLSKENSMPWKRRTHLERGVMIPGDMRGFFRGEMYTLLLPGTRSGELGNLYGLRGICGMGERVGGYKKKQKRQQWERSADAHTDCLMPDCAFSFKSNCRSFKSGVSHPSRCILQDVGFQLLHEHLVVEDDDGVKVALGDQHMLEGLEHIIWHKDKQQSNTI